MMPEGVPSKEVMPSAIKHENDQNDQKANVSTITTLCFLRSGLCTMGMFAKPVKLNFRPQKHVAQGSRATKMK